MPAASSPALNGPITINYVNNANVPAEVCPAVNISRYHAGDCARNLAGFNDAPQHRHTCKCLRTVDSGGRVLAGRDLVTF